MKPITKETKFSDITVQQFYAGLFFHGFLTTDAEINYNKTKECKELARISIDSANELINQLNERNK
jgi:hypothetical protein